MEVEEGHGPGMATTRSRSGRGRASESHWLFPIEPFKRCPLAVKTCLPKTWLTLQDWTHLVLVLGTSSCLLLLLFTVLSLGHGTCLKEWYCIKELMVIVFILPCTTYFFRAIGQYDDRLQAKQQDARHQKEQLMKSYNDLLSDMDTLLTKSAESSAGLAERSFESKRRDFQRFLERAKTRYSTLYSGTKADSDALLKQFRRFVSNWLAVFEECSIDPMAYPKRVIQPEELNRCTCIAEVCELCLDRLRTTEVRFISIQRDQDQRILRQNRNELKRISTTSTRSRIFPEGRNLSNELMGSENGGRAVSWLSFGRTTGVRCIANTASTDGFPREFSFGCGRVVLLSYEHLMLLVAFLFGWALIFVSVFARHHNAATVALLFIAEICIVVVLLRFEEIDTIQQLEQEVQKLTQAARNVGEQREKMRKFWSSAQQLTELWLYRTVPRLDLYKELHSQLEDASHEDLLSNISGANQHLEELEKKLGQLEAWRNDGRMGVEVKKQFGKAINQLCQETEFDEILVKLNDIMLKEMQCLEAPLPLPSIADSPCSC